MDRLEGQPTYSHQIASLYKQIKTSDKVNTDQKVQVYINTKTKTLGIFQTAQEARTQGFKPLSGKKLFKLVKTEVQQDSVDQKTARTAAKALLLLPWNKPAKTERILAIFPATQRTISPEKAAAIDRMLGQIEMVTRSDEGGNGVIFFTCAPMENDPFEGRIAFKFVKDVMPVIVADRLLRSMGFSTPKSSYLEGDSPLRNKMTQQLLTRLSHINSDHHVQIKQQVSTMPCILIMNVFENIVSFRQLPPGAVFKLMSSTRVVHQLGRMIFIDTFINNTDRLNMKKCNLGNIMLNNNEDIVLLDHDLHITPQVMDEVKANLSGLFAGQHTETILRTLADAFQYDRKGLEPFVFTPDLLTKLKHEIDGGIKQACRDLAHFFSDPIKFNLIFQPFRTESQNIHCRLIFELINFIQRL